MPGLNPDTYRTISAKTASYSVRPEDIGKIFTNRGAGGAVTFTLPTVSTIAAGWWCEFFVVADQNVVIASQGSSDNIVTFNDAGADSITISTAGEIIGASVRVIWDGTSWLAQLMVHETQTPTIA